MSMRTYETHIRIYGKSGQVYVFWINKRELIRTVFEDNTPLTTFFDLDESEEKMEKTLQAIVDDYECSVMATNPVPYKVTYTSYMDTQPKEVTEIYICEANADRRIENIKNINRGWRFTYDRDVYVDVKKEAVE